MKKSSTVKYIIYQEVLHQLRNYSNARPLSSHTITRLLANNAYCYTESDAFEKTKNITSVGLDLLTLLFYLFFFIDRIGLVKKYGGGGGPEHLEMWLIKNT